MTIHSIFWSNSYSTHRGKEIANGQVSAGKGQSPGPVSEDSRLKDMFSSYVSS